VIVGLKHIGVSP